jgi:uncharacterized MAPEG superfamily protein
MADGRKNNGGHSNGGRKPKAEEQALVEKLSPMEKDAYKALKQAIEGNESWAVKMFFEYMYGKPKQTVDSNTTLNINDFDVSKIYNKKA